MTDQAAERLGLSRRTVERKIEQGAIPAFQPGGRGTAIRIDEGARYSWRRRGTLKILVPRVVSEKRFPSESLGARSVVGSPQGGRVPRLAVWTGPKIPATVKLPQSGGGSQ